MGKKITLLIPLTVGEITAVTGKKLYSVNDEVIFLDDAHPDAVTLSTIKSGIQIGVIQIDSSDTTSENLLKGEIQNRLESEITRIETIKTQRVAPVVNDYCVKEEAVAEPRHTDLFKVTNISGDTATLVGQGHHEDISITRLHKVTISFTETTATNPIKVDTA